MHYYFTAVSLVAGICLAFGILHLFIGLRRKDNKPLNLTFALFALCYATTLFDGIRGYSTSNVTDFVAIVRFDSIFVTGAFVSLAWYVAYYTGVRPLIFLWVLSAAFFVPNLVFIISPAIYTGAVSGLTDIPLPWGEKLVTWDIASSVWLDTVLLTRLVTLGFIIFALIRQFWRGERWLALILGLGMLPFIVAIFYEILGESGVVPFIPFGEFGFLGIAIAASLQMANSVIKTEEELAQHRQNLELLVDERTTELSQSNRQLAHEVEIREQAEQTLNRRVEELAILHQTAHAVSHVTDLTKTLQNISETITYLFDARYTHIIVSEMGQTELKLMVGFENGTGLIEPTPLNFSLDDSSFVRKVLSGGESLAVTDIQSHSFTPSVQEFIITRDLQGLMLIPMLVSGDTIGLMSIATDQIDRHFSKDEVKLAETMAADIAAAIENVRLLEQAESAGAAQERGRIARELHDSVTQTMYSVSIVAEALPRLLERNPDEAKRSAAYLRQTTLGALAEMRTLLFELRPGTLAKTSLNMLLQQLADALTGRTRVPVEVTIEGQQPLAVEAKIALYRIAQETFTNINKHAKATRVWVTLRREPERVILTIRDNGQGFNPESVSIDRLGLQIMRERAEEIEADLKLESEEGQGTQVSVVWFVPVR